MIAPAACSLEDLAYSYAATRSAAYREQLCEAALPLVRRLAVIVLRRLPSYFTPDDLVGDGCVGLLRAIDRYDPSHGISFEKWAARIIRGAMLNGLRRMDIVPERIRRDARNLDRSRWRLAQDEGKTPSDSSAATDAGLTTRKLRAVLLALRRAVPISLDAPLPGVRFGETLSDKMRSDAAEPAQVVAELLVREAVARAVTTLPPRERMVIASFYAGETTFRAIGGRLGISKQRVSQIHGRAIANLRTILSTHGLDG